MTYRQLLRVPLLVMIAFFQLIAQTQTDLAALKGLSPVTILSKSSAGNAALGANYAVTGGIQTGIIKQKTPLPFAKQQEQALRDVFMTTGNIAQLADGLGTALSAAYLSKAYYSDRDHYTSVSQSVADLIDYAYATTAANGRSCKYFFGNLTTDGKTPVSADAMAIIKNIDGSPDMFGRAYNLPAGSAGADPFGNSRPFQTEPSLTRIIGIDYFNCPADNIVYNRGPMMNLVSSPSFPSGHTTYGYTGAILMAVLVPERYSQMITRGAEYGNDRILVGAHYAMDVLGGRTLALYDMAHLLANDTAYIGKEFKNVAVVKDFQALLKQARADLDSVLKTAGCKSIAVCAARDTGRFRNQSVNEAFYASTQTYNLPVVYPKNAGVTEDVSKIAPEAGHLLTAAFPSLTLEEANKILTETEGEGGGFLDDGSAFGVYSRLNLYEASKRAARAVAGRKK